MVNFCWQLARKNFLIFWKSLQFSAPVICRIEFWSGMQSTFYPSGAPRAITRCQKIYGEIACKQSSSLLWVHAMQLKKSSYSLIVTCSVPLSNIFKQLMFNVDFKFQEILFLLSWHLGYQLWFKMARRLQKHLLQCPVNKKHSSYGWSMLRSARK